MTLDEILQRFPGRRQKAGAGWLVVCPAHADGSPSLSIGVKGDKIVVSCKAGCATEAVLHAGGFTFADLFLHPSNGAGRHRAASPAPLTLQAFADAKRLPADFLRELGVVETADARGRRALRLTYRERDGREASRQRRRWALAAKDGSAWEPGEGSPIPYGRWKLDDAMEHGALLLVEGETDTLAAWWHNVPCLGIPGADLVRTLTAADLAGLDTLHVVKEPDRGGETFVGNVATRLRDLAWAGQALVVTLPVKDVHALHCTAGDRFADDLQRAITAAMPLAAAVRTPTAPQLRREGLDLVMDWPGGVRFTLTSIRDGREGVRGELTVSLDGRRISWGVWALSSVQAREALRKKLDALADAVPWGDYLEDTAYRMTQAAREGEPMVTLTGAHASAPARALLPGLLYYGEPTVIFADGDSGKSLTAAALCVATGARVALPFGLVPTCTARAGYLDWETSESTVDERIGRLAAGWGVPTPPIDYKRMTRSLADVGATVAAEFARRGVGFVVIDSMMFAVGAGDGGAFHEPIIAFWNAVRLFAPVPVLVLNHVTNADARTGGPARPFGGAFAHNGPRLVWEAKRDRDVTDATAIAFTCTKANNLERRPDPFGLEFTPGDGMITISPLNLAEAAPQTVGGAGLPWRVRTALASAPRTVAELAAYLTVPEDTAGRVVRRLAAKGTVVKDEDVPGTGGRGHAARWRLADR